MKLEYLEARVPTYRSIIKGETMIAFLCQSTREYSLSLSSINMSKSNMAT